jgi:hypothetical protein
VHLRGPLTDVRQAEDGACRFVGQDVLLSEPAARGPDEDDVPFVRVQAVQRTWLDEHTRSDPFQFAALGRSLDCASLGARESGRPDESDVVCSGHVLSVAERFARVPHVRRSVDKRGR